MEAVALHAPLPYVLRQRHQLCHGRLSPMEARVEAGDLGHVWQNSGNGIDGREVVRLMQRCEWHEPAQVREDLWYDDRRSRVLRPAMDNPVPDAAHPHAAKAPAEPTCYMLERGARVNDRISRHAIHQHDAARVERREARRGPYPLDLATHLETPGAGFRQVVDGELEARRAGVDHQRVVGHGDAVHSSQ